MIETLEQFIEAYPPPGKVIFSKIWGSRSHNTHKPLSDTDFSGVYICHTSDIVSLYPPPESFTHSDEEKNERPDYAFYEVSKFCQLLLKGNPGIIEMLFTDRLFQGSKEWDKFVVIREHFLTQEAVNQYLGYMNGQLKRLSAGQALHTKGGVVNEKWVYHILRLAGDAKRIARGQHPVVWKEGDERDFLMKVRNGDFTWLESKTLIENAIVEIEALKPFKLPEQGDKALLNELLVKLRMENW